MAGKLHCLTLCVTLLTLGCRTLTATQFNPVTAGLGKIAAAGGWQYAIQ